MAVERDPLDSLLDAGSGGIPGSGGTPPGAPPPQGDRTPPGGSPASSGGIEGDGHRYSLDDLKTMIGRQASVSKQAERLKDWEPVIKHLEEDSDLADELLEEIKARVTGQTQDAEAPVDLDRLWKQNPRAFVEEMNRRNQEAIFNVRQEYAAKELAAEKATLKKEFNLSDVEVKGAIQTALRYRDSNGDPMALRDAVTMIRQPQLIQQQKDQQELLNRRASGIPGNRRTVGVVRKDVTKMTENERKAAMLDDWANMAGRNGP